VSRLEELRTRISAREARIGVIGLGYVGLPAHAIGLSLLAAATLLTLWSGWEHFADYLRGAPGGNG